MYSLSFRIVQPHTSLKIAEPQHDSQVAQPQQMVIELGEYEDRHWCHSNKANITLTVLLLVTGLLTVWCFSPVPTPSAPTPRAFE